jgi:hypothetical protein
VIKARFPESRPAMQSPVKPIQELGKAFTAKRPVPSGGFWAQIQHWKQSVAAKPLPNFFHIASARYLHFELADTVL